MPDIMAEEPIRIRDCACPGSPHAEGDLVRLWPKLPARGGAAASYVLYTEGNTAATRAGALFEVLLVAGVGWWNLVQEVEVREGRQVIKRIAPVPVHPMTIPEQIGWGDGGSVLFNPVMDLYGPAIFSQESEPEVENDDGPLPTSESSGSGPMDSLAEPLSTSATRLSSVPPRKPSNSSSPANTAMAF